MSECVTLEEFLPGDCRSILTTKYIAYRIGILMKKPKPLRITHMENRLRLKIYMFLNIIFVNGNSKHSGRKL